MASMLTVSAAVFGLAITLSIVRWFVNKPPRGLKAIPGPWGIPFAGRVHDVDVQRPWEKVKEWCDEYDGFFQTTIMGETHLWIGKQDIAFDLLAKKASIYSSRPMVPAVPGSDTGAQYLPLMKYDDHWRMQRKFGHTVLAQAHNAKYFDYITYEVKRLLANLIDRPDDYYELEDLFCSRITSKLAYGTPIAAAAMSRNAGLFVPQISPSGPITNLMPFLGGLPEWMNPSIAAVRDRREKEAVLFKTMMQRVKTDMALGVAPPSYARTFYEKAEKDSEGIFDENEAAYAVGMLCTVAIITVSGPLYTFMLAMVLHEDWQEKARKEVDMVLSDRIADMSDSPYLPTLRAVIKECVRWRPPVPLGVPRRLEADDVYNGHHIPKDTIVHAVELALARDPALYPDAELFRPERWLEPSFPTYKEPLTEHPKLMGHHQFGFGRRMCPGIEITEAELLVACSALLWGFNMTKRRDANDVEIPVDPDRMSPSLIGGPLPFNFELKARSEKRAEQIRQLWKEVDQPEPEQFWVPFREHTKFTK